jgi:hypothetical protein
MIENQPAMVRTVLIVILLLTPLTQVMPLWAQGQESPPPEDVERVIEEILRLRGEAAELLEALSPELRDEVERRWEELQAASPEEIGEGASDPVSSSADSPDQDDTASVPAEIQATEVPEPELEPEDGDQSPAASEVVSESEPEPAKECDSLGPLDTNGDGVISASDRNWRYLRLRADIGGRSTNMVELESLYDLDIREIDVNLRFYKLSDGAAGDIFIDDRIRFELLGKRKSSRRSMILFIQASRLARSGELQLVDPSGALLAGDQPLAPGVALQTAEGSRLPLLCP